MQLMDKTKVTLLATSMGALRHLVHRMPLDLDSKGPRQHRSGGVTIGAFVTQDDLDEIGASSGIEIIEIAEVIDLTESAASSRGQSVDSRFLYGSQGS